MRLRTRFFIGFGLIGLLAVVMGGTAIQTYRIVSAQFDMLKQDIIPGALYMLQTKAALHQLVADLELDLASGTAATFDRNMPLIEQLKTDAAGHTTHETHIGDEEGSAAQFIEDRITAITDAMLEIQALSLAGSTPEDLLPQRTQINADLDLLSARFEEHLAEHLIELDDATGIVDGSIEIGGNSTILLVIVTLTVGGAVSYVLMRGVLVPLYQIREGSRRITEGNYAHRLANQRTQEFNQVVKQFNAMAEAVEYRDKVQIARLEEQLQATEAARSQAVRSDQVKSAFLASMSHELRTPLNAIINFTQFVLDGDLGTVNREQKDLLTEVVNSGRHLLTLINDVLDMSKIEAGSLKLFIEQDLNLNQIINSATSTARSLLLGKPVRLHVEVEESLPLMQGDRQRLLQVLLNILSNACKFTDEGDIRVRAERVGDEVRLSVSDTGPGIAPEDQAVVFQAFKQTQSGLRKGGGTGLGMPIARNLVEAHRGRLWLESVPAKGTTFHVAFPIQSALLVSA
jgi:signal transduction histidine kinase